MRDRTKLFLTGLACAAAVSVAASLASGAEAQELGDEVYADSFGNLIVQSPYGFKRIVVGEGYRAKQLAGYTSSSGPKVVYDDVPGAGYRDRNGVFHDTCYRPPVLLKGRSYMYGLPDGVVPEPSGHCE